MGESVVAWDFLVLNTSRGVNVGAWWFETDIAGTEWDPVLFTTILNNCRTKTSADTRQVQDFLMDAEITELSLFRKDK